MNRVYLNIPYREKDEAKQLGNIYWDVENKKWFCYEEDALIFAKYLPASSVKYSDLSDEQKHSIEVARQGKNVLIDACIGSGKTTTIQVLCNELPNKKILYLTYNRLLKEDAQAKITSPNTQVTNYDGFAYVSLKKNNCPVDIERNIIFFNRYQPPTDMYDILILDEYQDLKEDSAEMLMLLKKRNPNMQLVVVGDMQQKIYNFTRLDVARFIDRFLGTYEKLNFTNCFRLNENHAKHLGVIWDKNIHGVNIKNEILHADNLNDVVEFLKDKNPSDILVLGAREGDSVKVLNMLETRYPDKFNKNTVYASIRDEDNQASSNRSKVAVFTTFDSSKGLERKYCVVLDYTAEYWQSRSDKPGADYTTLKNLFLVAASRGKDQIMFFSNEDMDRHALPDSLIAKPFNMVYSHPKPFQVSEMFDFIYKEDVEHCFELIKCKPLNKTNPEDVIKLNNKDGFIDLSPCIGEFIEANFFDNYDLNTERLFIEESDKIVKAYRRKVEGGDPEKIGFDNPDATVEEKILMLTAASTMQDRYIWQVEVPFVKDEEKNDITERMKQVFDKKEDVQKSCEVDFVDNHGIKYEISGICDVIKDNTIWELKFEEELKQTNYLQLAFYLCAVPEHKGILYNVKTNEMIEVSVPNKTEFLKATVEAITKRNVRPEEFYIYELDKTNFKNKHCDIYGMYDEPNVIQTLYCDSEFETHSMFEDKDYLEKC